jgi:hypothetical protein
LPATGAFTRRGLSRSLLHCPRLQRCIRVHVGFPLDEARASHFGCAHSQHADLPGGRTRSSRLTKRHVLGFADRQERPVMSRTMIVNTCAKDLCFNTEIAAQNVRESHSHSHSERIRSTSTRESVTLSESATHIAATGIAQTISRDAMIDPTCSVKECAEFTQKIVIADR